MTVTVSFAVFGLMFADVSVTWLSAPIAIAWDVASVVSALDVHWLPVVPAFAMQFANASAALSAATCA